MPSTDEDRFASIIAQADALIAQANAQLEKHAAFYVELGIDPKKVQPAIDRLPPKHKQELDRLIAEDRAAIEQEVEEHMARIRVSVPSGSAGKKRRTMV